MREIFAAMKEDRRRRRDSARELNMNAIVASGIRHEVRNNGSHVLLFPEDGPRVDVWPSTDKFMVGWKVSRGIIPMLRKLTTAPLTKREQVTGRE